MRLDKQRFWSCAAGTMFALVIGATAVIIPRLFWGMGASDAAWSCAEQARKTKTTSENCYAYNATR